MPTDKKENVGGKTLTLNGKKYEIHPSAEMVPAMTEQEYLDLKADIAEHGVREPIVVYRNYIIDGIHRARAVTELGLKKRVQTRLFQGKPAEINSTIASLNAHRRHLPDKARAVLIAWGKLPELREQAKARKVKGKADAEAKPDAPKGEATAALAEMADVGQDTARKAADIVTHLEEKEIKKIIHAPREHFKEGARKARTSRLKAQGKKPPKERKPTVVDKIAPEYIKKRWFRFVDHWKESVSQQRKVREWVKDYLS
jgi:hypothetical protein